MSSRARQRLQYLLIRQASATSRALKVFCKIWNLSEKNFTLKFADEISAEFLAVFWWYLTLFSRKVINIYIKIISLSSYTKNILTIFYKKNFPKFRKFENFSKILKKKIFWNLFFPINWRDFFGDHFYVLITVKGWWNRRVLINFTLLQYQRKRWLRPKIVCSSLTRHLREARTWLKMLLMLQRMTYLKISMIPFDSHKRSPRYQFFRFVCSIAPAVLRL